MGNKLSGFYNDLTPLQIGLCQTIHMDEMERRKRLCEHCNGMSYFVLDEKASGSEDRCSECYANKKIMKLHPCGHMFCMKCTRNIRKVKNTCPNCGDEIKRAEYIEQIKKYQENINNEHLYIQEKTQKYHGKKLGSFETKKPKKIMFESDEIQSENEESDGNWWD